MKMDKVTQMGLDAHRKFSKVTGRAAQGRVVCRMRIDHRGEKGVRLLFLGPLRSFLTATHEKVA
ncbi:MAG: hypothetical protein V3W34_19340 [Phycisphaerae bacterium]